jgi:hypothetical protein
MAFLRALALCVILIGVFAQPGSSGTKRPREKGDTVAFRHDNSGRFCDDSSSTEGPATGAESAASEQEGSECGAQTTKHAGGRLPGYLGLGHDPRRQKAQHREEMRQQRANKKQVQCAAIPCCYGEARAAARAEPATLLHFGITSLLQIESHALVHPSSEHPTTAANVHQSVHVRVSSLSAYTATRERQLAPSPTPQTVTSK